MDLLQFIVERYNYWIFIILMMTGLYTVIARDNLIKKIIGLNIFQTSVFIFYISIGKVAGGTAPIYVTGDMERRTDHGDGHGGDHGAGHGVGHGGEHDAGHQGAENASESLHHVGETLAGAGSGHNDLSESLATSSHDGSGDAGHGVIHAPADVPAHVDEVGGGATGANDTFLAEGSKPYEIASAQSHAGGDHAVEAGVNAGMDLADVVYSNPLPHVLILTAIVVGVATTAVGLALVVRIREAYGVIEEDELEAADNVAEFGQADPKAGDPALTGGAT